MMHACVAPYKIASLYEGLAGRFCGHVEPDLILEGLPADKYKRLLYFKADID
jgi:hypothetical protein